MAQRFVCWKDRTDLTQLVRDYLDAGGGPVVMKDGGEPWRYVVPCPTDQAQNLFSSDIAAQHGPDDTVSGTPASGADTLWSDAAKQLTPANSLTRAGDSAKFTIQQISLVALVLGGFGIFTDLGGGFERNPEVFTVVVVAAAAALAAAVYAVFPKVEDDLDPNNIVAVRAASTRAIKHRARWAQIAAALLLVAIGAALVAFFIANEKPPTTSIEASWDGSVAKPTLAFTVEMKDLPKGAQPTVVVGGLSSPEDTDALAISESTLRRSSRGTAKLTQKFVPPAGYEALRITAEVEGKTESMTVQRPATE